MQFPRWWTYLVDSLVSRHELVWQSSQYKREFKEDVILNVESLLERINVNTLNQEIIDDLTKQLCSLFLNPAIHVGMTKEVTFPKRTSNRTVNNPWFNQDCKQLRTKYFNAKKKYKKQKTPEAKRDLHVIYKLYKKLITKTKKQYNKNLHNRLRNLKMSKPNEYWNILNNANINVESTMITNEMFLEHFKKLSQKSNCAKPTNQFDPRLITHSINEFINNDFTENKVKTQIKKLRNNKAPGIDLIINEYIKNSPSQMITLITQLFNIILNSGIIPTDWTLGIIKPIYKNKGSPNDPENYRGITLLSCIGKLFTAVINTRLSNYLEGVGAIGDEQAGFREGFSTLDHIFVLHSLIDLYLKSKKRVYCALIDYKKAFDLIDRVSLWAKLIAK